MKLLTGGYEVLKEMARRSIFVENLYATSRTPDGVKLCRDLGFQEIETNSTDAVKRFWLNVDTTTSPLFHEYQEIAKGHLNNMIE
jgi:hypothetical protein